MVPQPDMTLSMLSGTVDWFVLKDHYESNCVPHMPDPEYLMEKSLENGSLTFRGFLVAEEGQGNLI